MHTTLVFLLAAGHLANAQDSIFSYSPRETTSDDNLATITALSNGHLPTCFTNHPTHPCPTDGPGVKRDLVQDLNHMAHMVPVDPISMTFGSASKSLPTDAPEPKVVERAAPLRVVPPSYIPQPSEWAIPGNFTFTDTITQNATGTAETSASATTSSSETAAPHPDSYLKTDSKQLKRDDTYGKKMNLGAIIESIRHAYKEPHATGTAAAHAVSPTGDALLKSSNATSATAGHDSVSSGFVPSGASKVIATSVASNTSTKVHLEGQIGTLLSAAMFPAAMRAPTTSLSQASAPATTPAQSIPEHSIVPIPMSQRPNTTAPNAELQAFVHTINTETAQSSSPSVPTASALATPLAKPKKDVKPDQKLAPSSSQSLSSAAPAQESGQPKTGEKLHHYLHSVALKKPSTTPSQEIPTSTSTSSSLVTPIASVHGNDTQAITRINTHTAVTLTHEQPAETPHAYTSAHHHHPRARRFIG
ncbi:hypothetical protein MBLNU13_g00130t1 [Cladosporium sp. NU13]